MSQKQALVFQIRDDTYMLATHTVPTWDVFRERNGVVSGKYAEQLARSIWRALFVTSQDVHNEYAMYYGAEYPSFEHFVRANVELIPDHVFDTQEYTTEERAAFFLERSNGLFDEFSHVFWIDVYHSFLRDDSGAELIARMTGGTVTCE